jgi:hypothetical protein
MGFLRTANAIVVHPRATPNGWTKVRTAAKVNGQPSPNLAAQASEILGRAFDPGQFLLSHCTLVASVDAIEVPGVKLGSIREHGKKVNRKFADFRVTAETDKYINNNLDCFSRPVLLKSYRTLIGAHNFLEHVQVEDLSKGRVIDAVARDIGDSIYVDILVATDRKHADLVADIEEERLNTLSMGCSVEFTTCTKCGNVAVDETELCECVKYAKGNVFLDERGRRHRIAELCGHQSEDPTGGVTFIEASWVASPAFTGAVMRNIIAPEALNARMAHQMQEVLSSPPPQWVNGSDVRIKAASEAEVLLQDRAVVGKVSDRRAQFDFGEGGEPAGEGGGEPAPPAPPTKFDELEDRILQTVMDRIERKVQDEVKKKEKAEEPTPEESSAHPNDNVQVAHAVRVARTAYAASVMTMIRTASSDADLMNKVAILDESFGVQAPVGVYRTALIVGPVSKYSSTESYLTACRDAMGHAFGLSEGRALLRLGRILNSAEGVANRNSTPEMKHRR